MTHIADTLIMLELEHLSLGGMLDLVDALSEEVCTPAGVSPELLGLVFEYFLDYPEICHHPKEDAVFRRIESRDPAAARRVGDLVGGHERLSALTRHTARLARDYEGGRGDAELVRKLEEFTYAYRSHLEHEDAHFFTAARSILRREDWDLVDFDLFDREDPLYDHSAEHRFHQLRALIGELALDPDAAPRQDDADE